MRVRSLLLGACMVVVPLLAMFSHHLPPNLCANARTTLWEPVAEWTGLKPAQAPPRSSPAPAQPEVRPTPVVTAAVPQPSAARASATVMPAAGFGSSATPDRRALEGRLAQLGATSIDCQPLQGGPDFLASCRVAVDPTGQLQRVFQAAGADAPAALGRLVAEVEAWKHRTASRPSAAPGS